MADDDISILIRARDEASRVLRGVGDAAGEAGKRLVSVGATLASVASLAGPMTTGLLQAGKGLVALGQASVALAPLAAFLPSLAGSAKLVQATFIAMGPALAKAFDPVVVAWDKAGDRVGVLATKHVPELANAFVKVNMPSISGAMDRIAVATNKVVLGVGKWVNSTEGQKTIKTISDATAVAFERLAPKVQAAAIELGRLAEKAGYKGIATLGKVIGDIVDAFTRWAKNTSIEDINKALDDLSGYGQKIKDTFNALRDVGKWMSENEDAVRKFSDALAVLGIALGVVSGNPVAVAIGSFTLLVNHWDTVKKAFTGAATWWSTTWAAIKNDPNVKAIWQQLKDIATTIKGDFLVAWNAIKPAFDKAGDAAKSAWDKIGPFVSGFLKDPNVITGLRTIALALGALVLGWATLSVGTVAAIGVMTAAIAGFVAYVTGVFVRTVTGALVTIINGFGNMSIQAGKIVGAIPGMGRVGAAMVKVGEDAKAAAAKLKTVSDAIGNIKSKVVDIAVNVKYSTYGATGNTTFVTGPAAKAQGGRVPGSPSMRDTEPHLLAKGEYVVNARATSRNLQLLTKVNSGASIPQQSSAQPAESWGAPVNVYVTNAVVGNEDVLARVVTDAVRRVRDRGYGVGFA